jgi:acetyl-CoA carboxylase alpha subunit
MAETLKVAIWDELQHLESLSLETLLDRRYQRLRACGAFEVA